MISKEKFTKYLSKYKAYDDGINKIADALMDICPGSSLTGSDLSLYYIDLLVDSLDGLGDYKFDVFVWWICEKHYGEYIKPGDFMIDDRDIPISSPEELYDWLINPDAEEGVICP